MLSPNCFVRTKKKNPIIKWCWGNCHKVTVTFHHPGTLPSVFVSLFYIIPYNNRQFSVWNADRILVFLFFRWVPKLSTGSLYQIPIITQRENNDMAMFLMFQQYDYLGSSQGNGKLHILRNFLINYLKWKGSSTQDGANQVPRPLTLIKKKTLLCGKQAF